MVTSGRIDISNQTTACDTSAVTISRSKPAILEGHLNVFAWNSFCEKMDAALEPLTKTKKILVYGIASTTIIGFVAAIMGLVTFGILARSSVDHFGSDPWRDVTAGGAAGSPFLGMIPFFAGMVLIVICGFGFIIYAGRQVGPVQNGMRIVCEETTALHPRVSFHVREEMHFWGFRRGYGRGRGYGHRYNDNVHVTSTNYIECYVADIETGTSPNVQGNTSSSAPPFFVTEPDIPVVVSLGVKSSEERMRELDKMKNFLTETDYETKKAEILSDI